MKIFLFGFTVICMLLFSGNRAKDKTKKTLNKIGEVLDKAGSEIAEGISKGVEETFSISVEKSNRLDSSGIRLGRASVNIMSASNKAKYVDFVFNKRTTLDRKDHLKLE